MCVHCCTTGSCVDSHFNRVFHWISKSIHTLFTKRRRGWATFDVEGSGGGGGGGAAHAASGVGVGGHGRGGGRDGLVVVPFLGGVAAAAAAAAACCQLAAAAAANLLLPVAAAAGRAGGRVLVLLPC